MSVANVAEARSGKMLPEERAAEVAKRQSVVNVQKNIYESPPTHVIKLIEGKVGWRSPFMSQAGRRDGIYANAACDLGYGIEKYKESTS